MYRWIYSLCVMGALSAQSMVTTPDNADNTQDNGPDAYSRLIKYYGKDFIKQAKPWQEKWRKQGASFPNIGKDYDMAEWYVRSCSLRVSGERFRARTANEALSFADALHDYAHTSQDLPPWLAGTIHSALPDAPTDVQIRYMSHAYAPLYKDHRGDENQLNFVIYWSSLFAQGARPQNDQATVMSIILFLSQMVKKNPKNLDGLWNQLHRAYYGFQSHMSMHTAPAPFFQASGFLGGFFMGQFPDGIIAPKAKHVAFQPGSPEYFQLSRWPSTSTEIVGTDTEIEDNGDKTP